MVGNPLGVSQDGELLARALEASELEREGRLQLSGKFLYMSEVLLGGQNGTPWVPGVGHLWDPTGS